MTRPIGHAMASLRLATRSAHQETDAVLTRGDWLASPVAYATFLARTLQFHRQVEAVIGPHVREIDGLDYDRRRRSPLLERDLAHLARAGVHALAPAEPPQAPSPLAIGDAADVLGCLYVVEGSSLGGKVLARRIKDTLGYDRERGASSFDPYEAATMSTWHAFGALVEAAIEDAPGELDRMLRAARATFALHGEIVTAGVPSSVASGEPIDARHAITFAGAPGTEMLETALLAALVGVVGAVVACDAEGRVRLCSAEGAALLGSLEGAHGRDVDAILARRVGQARGQPAGPLASALAGRTSAFMTTLPDGNGFETEIHVKASALLRPDGSVVGAVLTLEREHDVSDLYEPLMFGLHDPLTGLANRTLLGDRMDQAIARARRGETHFILFMIDLDRFKQINDEHGHTYGDQLLREVSTRLAQAVRPNDTVARVGGDEFVALCEGLDTTTQAESIAARLLAAAVAPVLVDGLQLAVGASVGFTVAGSDADPDTLLHEADLAMYEAKRRGRNRWTRFDAELARTAHRRAHLITALRGAFGEDGIGIALQPEVDLQHGSIVGYEALVRWKHPKLGQVNPAEIIAVAEQSDLIGLLGARVLDLACQQAASWPTPEGEPPLWVSVNVSARELVDPDFALRVLDTLERWGLPGTRLCLELTESSLIEATERAETQLDHLHREGVQLAIDDFGTGFASLTYLQRLPVQQVKIDRSFVLHLPDNREDDAIVTSVLNLAHNLDLTVVAEGIETEAQADFLRSLGCDIGQGYLFGRPLPGGEPLARAPELTRR